MLRRAAEALDAHRSEIATAVEERIFRELRSYPGSALPESESRETVLHIIDFVVQNLGRNGVAAPIHDSLMANVISFEEGIAHRRVRYRIGMIDLMRGVEILREEIWRELREAFRSGPDGVDFFELERKVNGLIDHLFVGISEAYLRSQDEIIRHHEAALEKWEEVVKSASSIELKIPCSSAYVGVVRLQAEAIARRVGFGEDEVHDIVYAVGEACDNAIEHGVSERGVDVHYLLTREDFRVEITDYGRGFDPTGRGEEPPDPFDERGRGIFMMRALMDEASIESTPQGTRVVLVKRLAR